MNWHWLRHDWGKWSEPYFVRWRWHTTDGRVLPDRDAERLTQRRCCKTCSKVSYRLVVG